MAKNHPRTKCGYAKQELSEEVNRLITFLLAQGSLMFFCVLDGGLGF